MHRDLFSPPKGREWLMLEWEIKKKLFDVHNVKLVDEPASSDFVAAER
jgi:hypothetical protein